MRTPLSDRLATAADRAPLVVAHRGASAECPENTLAAFRHAVAQGADMVELDFRTTADGVLVCMHDETLDRTTDAAAQLGRDRVALASLTLAQVQQLDAGAWKGAEFRGERVPTLEQALDSILPDAVPMIEHKDGSAAALVEVLRGRNLVERVLVQSFDWDWLAEVRELEPRLTLAALGSRNLDEERLASLDRLDTSMVHWNHIDLRVEDVERLAQLGQLTCVYTVNPDIHLLGAVAAGVHAITTDRPTRLRELLRR